MARVALTLRPALCGHRRLLSLPQWPQDALVWPHNGSAELQKSRHKGPPSSPFFYGGKLRHREVHTHMHSSFPDLWKNKWNWGNYRGRSKLSCLDDKRLRHLGHKPQWRLTLGKWSEVASQAQRLCLLPSPSSKPSGVDWPPLRGYIEEVVCCRK